MPGAGQGQVGGGLVDRFRGEREAAPVDAEAPRLAEVLVHAHGVVGVDVLLDHEPARFVGADWQGRDVERSVAPGDFLELVGVGRAVAGVAGKEQAEAGGASSVSAGCLGGGPDRREPAPPVPGNRER